MREDFDKYVERLRINLIEDEDTLIKMKQALLKGETDEAMVEAYERAYNADANKYSILLYAKELLDKEDDNEIVIEVDVQDSDRNGTD